MRISDWSSDVCSSDLVKGYGMGAAGESLNPTHGTKKMDDEDVKAFRDRFQIPVTDEQLKDGQIPFFHPGEKSPEVEYMLERRKAMGGFLPQPRKKSTQSLQAQPLEPPDRTPTDPRHATATPPTALP